MLEHYIEPEQEYYIEPLGTVFSPSERQCLGELEARVDKAKHRKNQLKSEHQALDIRSERPIQICASSSAERPRCLAMSGNSCGNSLAMSSGNSLAMSGDKIDVPPKREYCRYPYFALFNVWGACRARACEGITARRDAHLFLRRKSQNYKDKSGTGGVNAFKGSSTAEGIHLFKVGHR